VRLGVLASGQGSNLRNLLDRGFQVVAVATNRPSCGAAGLARERGLPLGEFSQRAHESVAARDAAMAEWLLEADVQLVVNAGYDRILTASFLGPFAGRVINLHPSLLPAFAGSMHAVEQALAAKVPETGCTVHLVTEEVDAGPILLQAAVPVLPADTVDTLRERIRAAEHRLLPRAVELMSERLAPTRTAVG
jgi:phosphoribosylglycinamide formyltransferase-1